MTFDEPLSVLADLYRDIDRQLTTPATPAERLSVLVRLAVREVVGAQWASVIRGRSDALRTVATTDARATVVDALQTQLASGPGIDALLHGGMSRTDDVRSDAQWPEFSRAAAEHSTVRSVLSYRLYVEDDELIACLNLYSTRPAAFNREAVVIGTLVTVHGANAIAAASAREEVSQLRRALTSNRDIGAAMGVLMARHGVLRDQAFDFLRRASQDSNRKIVDLAADVLDTGTLEHPRHRARLPGTPSRHGARTPADMPRRQHPAESDPSGKPAVARDSGAAVTDFGHTNEAERLHRLTALIEALSDTMNVNEVADVLWREAPVTVDAVATGLAILDAEGRRLHFVPTAGHLHSPPLRWASAAVTDDLPVAEATRTASPLYFGEPGALLRRYPSLRAAQAATSDRSWAIVPLTGPDIPQGVLTLAWARPRDFSESEKEFITALGRLCSSALSRAVLRAQRDRAVAHLRQPGTASST